MSNHLYNDSGEKILADFAQRINIHSIKDCKSGDTVSVTTGGVHTPFRAHTIKITHSQVRNGGYRLWFVAPCCQKRVGILYFNPIMDRLGCRICANIEYRSQRYKGMIEAALAS